MIENGTAISEAGNDPVETNEFIEEGKVSVSGIDVNYKVTESGETKFNIPDEVDQSSPAFIEWEKVASNEMKALAKANERNARVKKERKAIEQEKAQLAEMKEKLLVQQTQIETLMKTGGNKVTEKQKTLLEKLGVDNKSDFSELLEENPEQVLSLLKEELKEELSKDFQSQNAKTYEQQRKELDMRNKAGKDYDNFTRWATVNGFPQSEQALNLFKQVTTKAKPKSTFDNISRIQETQTKIVKESMATDDSKGGTPAQKFLQRQKLKYRR